MIDSMSDRASTLSTRRDSVPALRAVDFVLVALLAGVLVPMCLMYAGPAYMNADTPLFSIMSLQRLTLFIWGQNRFINLVPLLASPLRQPDANLVVQILIFGGGFIGLVALLGWVMARLVLRSERRLDSWLCFAALLFTFFTVASRYAVHVFVSEGQPYGLSGLLMGGGLATLLRPTRPGAMTIAAAALAMLLGGGLNPSLVLVAIGVCSVAFIFWPAIRRQAVVAGVLSVTACGFWLALGSQFPGPRVYSRFAITDVWANLGAAWRSLGLGFVWAPLVACAVLAAIAAVIIIIRPLSEPRPRWLLLGLCAGFALGWFGLFAENAWVIANGWHFRYFYPVTFVAMLILTAPPVMLLLKCGSAVRASVVVVLLAACPVLLAAPWQGLDGFPVFAHVAGFVAEARRLDVRLVAGSYWSVWPTVFMLSREGPAFGIEAERAKSNRINLLRAVARMEADGKRPRSLCVDADLDRCLWQAAFVTGRPWRVAALTCGVNCTLIELADEPR